MVAFLFTSQPLGLWKGYVEVLRRHIHMRLLQLFLLFILFQAFSCPDDPPINPNNVVGLWRPFEIQWEGMECASLMEKDYFLNIREDKRAFVLELQTNSCSGDLRFEERNGLLWNNIECQSVCCDSEDAKCLLDVLSEVKQYRIENDTLTLKDEHIKLLLSR